MFYQAYPEVKERKLCKSCYDTTVLVKGLWIFESNVYPATLCLRCKGIIADYDNGLLDGIYDRLDKLIKHLGEV